MPKRTAVEIVDALDWRVKTLRCLHLYAETEEGQASAEDIRTCMGMMILEMENILARTDGEDEHAPGGEGPLGPLPHGILE